MPKVLAKKLPMTNDSTLISFANCAIAKHLTLCLNVIVKYGGTIFLSLLSPKICNQYPGISGS